MSIVVINGDIRVPEWVGDFASFQRWCHSDEFPASGRIDYLQGEVWVDTGEEPVDRTHSARTEFTVVLGHLVRAERLGRYFVGGVRLTSAGVKLSILPAGLFIANERFRRGAERIRDVGAGRATFDGVPDMVLEFSSDDVPRRAAKRLRTAYRQAGIAEYWLVQTCGEGVSWDIFRHTGMRYVAVRKRDGWLKSRVFGKSFRLTGQEDEFGNPDYTLEVRQAGPQNGFDMAYGPALWSAAIYRRFLWPQKAAINRRTPKDVSIFFCGPA